MVCLDSLAEKNGPTAIQDAAHGFGSYRAKNSGALDDCTPSLPCDEKRGGRGVTPAVRVGNAASVQEVYARDGIGFSLAVVFESLPPRSLLI